MRRRLARGLFLLAGLLALSCAPSRPPQNIEPVDLGGAYQVQYRSPPDVEIGGVSPRHLESARLNAERCAAPLSSPEDDGGLRGLDAEVLTRGDLVDVRLAEDEVFTGAYVVSRDGALKLPFLSPVPAEGRTVAAVEREIARRLADGGYYTERPPVSVRLTDFAPVTVGVAGAVFQPGTVTIGQVAGDDLDAARLAALGASTEGRNLSVALRNAGGVRPDADLSAIELRRGERTVRLDLRPILTGGGVPDIMLVHGDRITVPSRGCFQEALVTPGPISPPGITLFLSNLTQPANANAPSAIGREAREVPYGTRFLQAVANANCLGGAQITNADRSAALFSRNPVTGVSVVIERRIEDLLRRADRDDYDPYLLPGDMVICYDSGVTNLAEIGRLVWLMSGGALLR